MRGIFFGPLSRIWLRPICSRLYPAVPALRWWGWNQLFLLGRLLLVWLHICLVAAFYFFGWLVFDGRVGDVGYVGWEAFQWLRMGAWLFVLSRCYRSWRLQPSSFWLLVPPHCCPGPRRTLFSLLSAPRRLWCCRLKITLIRLCCYVCYSSVWFSTILDFDWWQFRIFLPTCFLFEWYTS